MDIKITFLSDTHNGHARLKLEGGDILVHCGDSTNSGSFAEVKSFLHWMNDQDYAHKIVVAGNHDWLFQRERNLVALEMMHFKNFHYLEHSDVTIENIRFFGSPYCPQFGRWAFMEALDKRAKIWSNASECDILVTHSPPKEILDFTKGGDHAGCSSIQNYISKHKPKVHVFGHIHEGRGELNFNDTLFLNVSYMDEYYDPDGHPVTIIYDNVEQKVKEVING